MLLRITTALFVIIVSFIITIYIADVYAEQEKGKYQLDENQAIYNNVDSSLSSNNIAFVSPTFTTAAYDNSFYKFFGKYAHLVKKYELTGEKEYITSVQALQYYRKMF